MTEKRVLFHWLLEVEIDEEVELEEKSQLELYLFCYGADS
jgi:hypothetical protein